MKKDNLITPDGLTAREFLTNYYTQILESANNILRGRTKFDKETRSDIAHDLVSYLAQDLLTKQIQHNNMGQYAHRFMSNAVGWALLGTSKNDFAKLFTRSTYELDFNIPAPIESETQGQLLDEFLPWVKLTAIEENVYNLLRRGLTVDEMAEEMQDERVRHAIYAVLRSLRQKFADARAAELLEDGYIDERTLTDCVRKAIKRINGRNIDDPLSQLPDGTLGAEQADHNAQSGFRIQRGEI